MRTRIDAKEQLKKALADIERAGELLKKKGDKNITLAEARETRKLLKKIKRALPDDRRKKEL